MLSTALPAAPPSSLLHHNHRRRRRFQDSHLHAHAPHSHHLFSPPGSQQSPSYSWSPSSPLRFGRSISPSSSPIALSPTMADYRHVRSGSLNIPAQAGPSPAGPVPAPPTHGRFDGPRSPPNTSHVPCKFFRQGACQAGTACPFSHDLGAASETICKYFAKGNCKFGPKCANVHVLADGRRINYSKNGFSFGQQVSLGNRINPGTYNGSNSALTNSFMRADATTPYNASYGYPAPPNESFQPIDRRPSFENIPTIDTTYSHTSSGYGSPRDEDPTRLGLGLSPAAKGLSVLDAPLPASFDSNGISNAARYPAGPWPSSVPSQFGLESPSPSLNAAKDARTSEALKALHHSAFGSEHLSTTVTGSSPPIQPSDEYHARRALHSSRYARHKMLSSSAPRAISGAIDHDWEPDFPFVEEDYVPDNLKDLLTPAEKARRGSRAADDEMSAHRGNGSSPSILGMSGTGTPNADSASKFGSPLASSPSRWGSLFQRTHGEHEVKKHIGASAGQFGHIGSPLRQSSLSSEFVRTRVTGSTEALSDQLQRTRIDGNGSGGESPLLHPHAHVARPSGRNGERHVSSSSISSSARYTTPIGEEDGEFVFKMDDDADRDSTIRPKKRTTVVGSVLGPWGPSYGSTNPVGTKKDDDSSKVVDSVSSR